MTQKDLSEVPTTLVAFESVTSRRYILSIKGHDQAATHQNNITISRYHHTNSATEVRYKHTIRSYRCHLPQPIDNLTCTSTNDSADSIEDLITEVEAEMRKLSTIITAKARHLAPTIASLGGASREPQEDIRHGIPQANSELAKAKKIQKQLEFIEEEEKLSWYGKLQLMETALKGDEHGDVEHSIEQGERSYQGFVVWLEQSFPRDWLAFDGG